ncbi:glutathione S-transferase F2-like [Gossypium hirsutum]|uniref:glutathione transferase n=1 Tax=Gossypium hirsutum TaxID=3635 RepID=A0A1U8LIP4_GOSHI|nr:glutathione S-transferase F2-like [Gossypium hirsutum]
MDAKMGGTVCGEEAFSGGALILSEMDGNKMSNLLLSKDTVVEQLVAVMKVHGIHRSTATQKVLTCLYKKDVEFWFVFVNLGVAEHKSQNFLSPNLVFELRYKPHFWMTIDTTIVEENEAKLAEVLDVYEAHLAEYLDCDHFTLVYLHHLPNVQYLLGELDQEAV